LLFNNGTNTRALGRAKEQLAKQYLEQQSLLFVEQNFHCKMGEVDLIFTNYQRDTLIFVEVRHRTNDRFGGAAASITQAKIAKIKKTALFYMAQRKITSNIRFDVIAFEGEQLNWIPSAFS
jgi:putative endonuclease